MSFSFVHFWKILYKLKLCKNTLYIQSILIIHGYCICEFFYLPEFICNLKIDIGTTLAIFVGSVQSRKKSESPACLFPAGVGQRGLVSLLQLLYWKQGSFCGLFSAMLFTFLCFFWWFCCLRCPQSTVLKSCLMLLSTRRLWCVLWREHVGS